MNTSYWPIWVFYALLSSAALLLMKTGLSYQAFHVQWRPHFLITLPYSLVMGVGLYVFSFLMWLIIIRNTPVVVAYPLSVGLIQLFLLLGSTGFFHTRISVYTLLGSLLILAGIILLSLGGFSS